MVILIPNYLYFLNYLKTIKLFLYTESNTYENTVCVWKLILAIEVFIDVSIYSVH